MESQIFESSFLYGKVEDICNIVSNPKFQSIDILGKKRYYTNIGTFYILTLFRWIDIHSVYTTINEKEDMYKNILSVLVNLGFFDSILDTSIDTYYPCYLPIKNYLDNNINEYNKKRKKIINFYVGNDVDNIIYEYL